MMSLAIFLSYGLQFYVPIQIIEPWFRERFTGEVARQVSDAGLRVGLIVFTCEFVGLFLVPHSVAVYNFGALYVLFSRSSYFGRDRTTIGCCDIAGRQRELFDAGIDLSAAHRNHHILSAQFGPIQLGALEGHFDHGVWHRRLYIRLICEYARYSASTAAIGGTIQGHTHQIARVPRVRA